MKSFGYQQSNVNHSLFYHHSLSKGVTLLLGYVDDTIIFGSNTVKAQFLSHTLAWADKNKYIGLLQYFFGLEVAFTVTSIFICQWKYILDPLQELGKWGSLVAVILPILVVI